MATHVGPAGADNAPAGSATGPVGLYRYTGASSPHEFADFKVGYDNNSDGDILDAGDDVHVLDTTPAA